MNEFRMRDVVQVVVDQFVVHGHRQKPIVPAAPDRVVGIGRREPVGDRARVRGALGIAEPDPDVAVALHHGELPDPDVRSGRRVLVLTRDGDARTVLVVDGAVVRAADAIPLDAAGRQRREAMRASVLECDDPARRRAVQNDSLVQKRARERRFVRDLGGFRGDVPRVADVFDGFLRSGSCVHRCVLRIRGPRRARRRLFNQFSKTRANR